MRVLFVEKQIDYEPQGIMSLSACLKQAGHDVALAIAAQEDPVRFAQEYEPDIVAYSVMTGSHRWYQEVNLRIRDALRDKVIRAGDALALFYPSANRDEEVFEDGDAFRIDRDPNPHLGFGVGEHFCLGAHLARMDLRVFWRQFAERIEAIEYAGPLELLHASFVGGPKHMPVRFRMKPRA